MAEGPEPREFPNVLTLDQDEFTPEEKYRLQRCRWMGCIFSAISSWSLNSMSDYYNIHIKKTKPAPFLNKVALLTLNSLSMYLIFTPLCAANIIKSLMRRKMQELEINKTLHQKEAKTLPMEDVSSLQSKFDPDMDSVDPSFSHLSISYESNLGSEINDGPVFEKEEVKPKVQTTYAELRRKNREAYLNKKMAEKGMNSQPKQPEVIAESKIEPTPELESPKVWKTNKYGDPLS